MAAKHLPFRAVTSTILVRIQPGRALSISNPKARKPKPRSKVPDYTFSPATRLGDEVAPADPAGQVRGDTKEQRTSTITRAEQRIFDRIQSDLTLKDSADASTSASSPSPTYQSYEELDELRVLALFSEAPQHNDDEQSDLSLARGADDKIRDDQAEVVIPAQKHTDVAQHVGATGNTRPGHQRLIQGKTNGPNSEGVSGGTALPSPTYDELVDKHARKIIRIIGKSIKQTAHNETFPPELHSLFPQGSEDAIMAVDFATWKVCEDLIFPMIDILDAPSTNQSDPNQEKDLSIQGSQPHIPNSRNDEQRLLTQDLLESPSVFRDGVRPHSIILRVYPAALLLALRHLAKYKASSPYALALLPRIRALGATSYVLGGTVSFYNTLIKLYWDVYSDLEVIDGLLHEMERGGIEWDVETLDVLSLIEGDRSADLHVPSTQKKVRPGSRSAQWWKRSLQVEGYETVCVKWKGKITSRLIEKGWGGRVREDIIALPVVASEMPYR